MKTGQARHVAVAVWGPIVAATLWLPWVRLGNSNRSSFGALRSAQRLGLDELAPFRVIWFMIPLVGFSVLGAGLLRYKRVASAVLAAFCLIVGSVGLLVLVAGSAAWGAGVSLGVSLVGLALAANAFR